MSTSWPQCMRDHALPAGSKTTQLSQEAQRAQHVCWSGLTEWLGIAVCLLKIVPQTSAWLTVYEMEALICTLMSSPALAKHSVEPQHPRPTQSPTLACLTAPHYAHAHQ